MKLKKLTRIGVLTALALVTFVIENQIPLPLPFPGVKLGLSNIFTLLALTMLGPGAAACLLFLRIVLGSLLTSTLSALLYSLSGGVLAFLCDLILLPLLERKRLWLVSVFASIGHNLGQITVAWLIIGRAVLAYMPILLIAGIITGLFTGLAAQAVDGRKIGC